MLEKFRDGMKSTWAKVVMAVIIASFIFAGIGSYLVNNVKNEVAVVNGDKISRFQFDRRLQLEKNRMGKQYAQFYNTEAAQQQFVAMVVDRMIFEKLVEQASRDLGLYVSRKTVMADIAKTSSFQLDGKFNSEIFKSLLASNGLTPDQYERQVRQSRQTAQLSGMLESEFALPNETDHLLSLQGQTRSGGYISIKTELLEASVGFEGLKGEQKLKDFYQQNLKSFEVPEKVIVQYVELDANKLKIDVTEEQLKTYYDEYPDDFGSAEERKASHILIAIPANADKATVKKAKAKAEKLLAEIKAGKDFATIASKNSDDTVSAEKGGDLGFFSKGVMDPAFETAAFALKKTGDLSEIVRSAFGFHIIKLTGIKPGTVKPFDDVKAEVSKAVEASLKDEKFVELNDVLTEKAFEVVDSLDEVAASTEQEIKTSEPFAKTGGKGIFANPAVIEATFSDNVMVNDYNSDVIPLSENHSVVLRIKKVLPARTKTFDEVRAQVEQRLRLKEARDKAEILSGKVLDALTSGETADKALTILPEQLKAKWVTFDNLGRNDKKLPLQLTGFIFKMAKPADGKSVFAKTATFTGFEVVQLNKVINADPAKSTAAQKKQQAEVISREKASAEDRAFQVWLKKHADIERKPLTN